MCTVRNAKYNLIRNNNIKKHLNSLQGLFAWQLPPIDPLVDPPLLNVFWIATDMKVIQY